MPKQSEEGAQYPCQNEEGGWRAWLEIISLVCLVRRSQAGHPRMQPAGICKFIRVNRFSCKQKTEGQDVDHRTQRTILQHNGERCSRALNLANTGKSTLSISNAFRSTTTSSESHEVI